MKIHNKKKYADTTIQSLLVNILKNFDTPVSTANKVAEKLIRHEKSGYPSHGVRRIIQYVNDIKNKTLQVNAFPSVKKITDNINQINGNFSFGVHVMDCTIQTLIDQAKNNSVSIACVTNAHHLGRLHDLGFQLANTPNHLIVIGFCNYSGNGARVAPPGDNKEKLCTNPMLLAFPVKNSAPFVLDMSTSVVSEGNIACAYESNQRLPDGLLLGKKGEFIHDPAALYQQPSTATIAPLGYPFAGHKGYGLAVFVEAIVALLSGASHVAAPSSASGNNLFVIALNPLFFNEKDPAELGKEILRFCYASDDTPVFRYPGSQSENSTLPDFIELPDSLYQQILSMNNTRIPS